jgi:hypothetical protein
MSIFTESRAVAPPKLRPARPEDYEAIVRLGLAHSLDVPSYEDWSSLWLDNPLRARGKDFPIGWVLVLPDGETVGTMGTVRARYTFRGGELITAVSRAWFVSAPYRGFALQLMDEYLNQPGVDLFINNAVSIPALGTFEQFCERIPLGEWDGASYWVTASPPDRALLAKDAVSNKPLPKMQGLFTIDGTDRFDSRFDVFWDELVRQRPEKLIAERTSEALSWHFAAPMRRRRLWILTASRKGRLLAYCTLTRQDHAFRLPALPHGDTQGLRGMRLVDYQSIEPETDFLPALLHAALQRCATEGLYILENLGRGVPKMRVVDECAPHYKKLGNWKFFYRAADPALDAELRESKLWDPSAYDGDASFE